MMKILICDDEGIAQESIRFMIKKSFGKECELKSAKNGREAIEFAESFRPDIILMDIQMPGINGLEAMQEIRKENKNIIFIVLTAYDKFEYTQRSIDIGVMAYLTKPINRDKLIEAIRCGMRLAKEHKEKMSRELQIKEKMEAVVPIIENGFLSSVLLEKTNEEAKREYLHLLNIGTKYGYVMMIECGDELRKGVLSNPVGAGMKLQKHAMVFREIVREMTGGITGAFMANKVVVAIPCINGEEDYEERVIKIDNTRRMLRKLEGQLGLAFKAGIGSVKLWEDMLDSYREAAETVRQGIGKVTHAKDMPVSCVYEKDYPSDLEKELFDAISKGKQDETKQLSTEFMEWMESHVPKLDSVVRLKALEFVLWAEHLAYSQGGMIYRLADREGYLEAVLSMASYQELEAWFVGKILDASHHIASNQQEKTDNVVEKAKAYIAKHVFKELRLEDMAKEIGISPYYLSKLFKEAEGINYVDYVTKLRVAYAKEQLQESNKSIKEICVDSGYSDPNYFSRIFKKWTGATPTEFREGGKA